MATFGLLTLTATPLTGDVGQTIRLTATIVDSTGTPAPPATCTLTITLPDATTQTVVIGGLTLVSAGVYIYDLVTTESGLHTAAAVSTVPNGADDTSFTITGSPSPVSLDYVKAHLNMSGVTIDDAELETVIAAAVSLTEDLIGPVIPRTVTETFNGGTNQIVLRTVPVLTVTSVNELLGQVQFTETADVRGSSYALYGYQLDDGGILTKHLSGWPAPFFPGIRNVQVIYTAGRATLPAKIQLGIAELVRHLWQTQQGSRSRQAQPGDYAAPPDTIPRLVRELFALDMKLPGIA